jgi:uncharacterized glyoxalase superfamily protein PhnB
MTDDAKLDGVRAKAGYPAIVPYLMVADATALMRFFEEGFGAARRFVMPSSAGGITHAEIAIGDGLVMLSDEPETPHAAIHICLYVADVDAVYSRAVAAGAVSLSAPETKEYGDRVAGITDPAGNTWWICARVS